MNAPTPTTFSEVAAAVEARIARARVRLAPFPHIVVDDLLPAPVLRAVTSYWPDPARLSTTNHFQRAETYISVLARDAEGQEQAFWNALRSLTVRAGQAARNRLSRHFHDKFRPLIGPDWRRRLGTPGYLDRDAMLAHYTGAVDMRPHVDHARIVVNGFVYLDDPDQPTPDPRRGTMLYRSLGLAWPSNTTIPKIVRDRYLREAEDVTWRDNRLLAYVNGPWSFHGVPAHDLGTGRRRLLMFGSVLDKATMDRVYDAELR